MTLNDYQRDAARTLVTPTAEGYPLAAAVASMGLSGEAGEVTELLKKHLGHGHALDKERLGKELGDVLWYVSALATLHGLTLPRIAADNLDKLRRRYPEGFSESRSRERAE